MTSIGKLFVFFQFIVSMALFAIGFGVYSHHIDWSARIKEDAKRISDLGADRDRAETKWALRWQTLNGVEAVRPQHQALYNQKLVMAQTGKLPAGVAAAPASLVTEIEYDQRGYLNVLGTKPIQYRGTDVQYYDKIQEDLARYRLREMRDGRLVLGLIPTEQEKIQAMLKEYAQLTERINGNDSGLRGLRAERDLADNLKKSAIQEQENLKPSLANRYGETVLLLKRQNSLLTRKTELDRVASDR